ncbi:MAG: PD-(D/E)XK nuclease family protein, partial [Lentimicrobiaceae bacterium]|nr:PD-(D/E)XK nuclease family protein [Lentimicrobiaceae bacterium]
QTTEIQCGIIAFQELYKQNEEYIYYAEIEKDKILTQKLMLLFEEHLKQLLLSIFDEKTAFSQTDDIDNCQYCDYKNICNR